MGCMLCDCGQSVCFACMLHVACCVMVANLFVLQVTYSLCVLRVNKLKAQSVRI